LNTPSICVVGQILVDVFLPSTSNTEYRVRLGGICHAARALWALGCRYGIAHASPQYLHAQVHDYLSGLASTKTTPIGCIVGCPNVMLIGEPKEIGDQAYEHLLRDEQVFDMDVVAFGEFLRGNWDDVLLFPSENDFANTLDVFASSGCQAAVHADMNFIPAADWRMFQSLPSKMETMILSTSSNGFLHELGGSSRAYKERVIPNIARRALLKENRGGSRLFSQTDMIQTPAQSRNVVHSVGVGDCFDAVYLALRREVGDQPALAYAACVASEYAVTHDLLQFRRAAQSWLQISPSEISELAGVSLSWEERSQFNVYIAGPDFNYVDTHAIDALEESLRYHNFTPRRPVKEHGQMGEHATTKRRQQLCDADLSMLHECSMLVAVYIQDDPGTMIEIGLAIERRMPVIVYDPATRAQNLMLTQLPYLVSNDLDAVVSAVFAIAQQLQHS
jgi:nucleoside 2-deoxyribosyltransferase